MSENTLRPMTAADLETVFRWRNDPQIRRFMYTTHQLEWTEHCAWFERTLSTGGAHLLIYQSDQTPLGFVNISCKRSKGVADWGFYLAPEAPVGTGRSLGAAVLRFSFDSLRLHKLCGEVLSFNERSIRFHQRLGFTQEGRLREQHFDGDRYHDIVCFGLLKSEWQAFSQRGNHVS
ncbi:UDP-4-amino-4,6-dideoxy-N-acetyl-beta-L-altrosamine N-acetyltransferase [Marinobacter similis]|nr:UDP-4-amino-4,6-dideoxy-N-acetyl-beta-L-altrosamine N-acetyltransferase [Marinobacter similis]